MLHTIPSVKRALPRRGSQLIVAMQFATKFLFKENSAGDAVTVIILFVRHHKLKDDKNKRRAQPQTSNSKPNFVSTSTTNPSLSGTIQNQKDHCEFPFRL
jgi:hypothetical protein